MRYSVSQPFNNQPINNQSVSQSINQSIKQSVSQSVNQSINQSNSQSVSQSVSRSVIQSLTHSWVSQSVVQTINVVAFSRLVLTPFFSSPSLPLSFFPPLFLWPLLSCYSQANEGYLFVLNYFISKSVFPLYWLTLITLLVTHITEWSSASLKLSEFYFHSIKQRWLTYWLRITWASWLIWNVITPNKQEKTVSNISTRLSTSLWG